MNNGRIGLIILLLLLAVGFVSVTTNLIINNNVNISIKTDDFSVVFTSANTEEESTATISEDKKVITYITKELVNPGDKSELEYTIKNNSSQYDADINLSTMLDSSISELVSITYETIDASNTINLSAKNEITGKIKIELIKPVINNMEISLTVMFDANATERSSIVYEEYKVRFNSNGGTGSMDDQTMTYGIPSQLSSNKYTRSGYQMVGWTTNPETNEVYYANEEEVSHLTSGGGTIDLYALWIKNDYTYTGGEQMITIPATGLYKLETWGAQGGTYSSYRGGYGGYSVGTVKLNKNTNLYINVGGVGACRNGIAGWQGCESQPYANGGYNGGGDAQPCDYTNGCAGGGATHIATSSGLIATFENKRQDLLIVSGGGGGGAYNTHYSKGNGGGAGGGANGTNASLLNTDYFGYTPVANNYAGGGGGGYIAGKCSTSYVTTNTPIAGGGSGYIGNPLMTDKKMVCYNCQTSTDINSYTISNTCAKSTATENCAKTGAGYARITFISPNN